MNKTDIGVVAFFYIVGLSFLAMTLQLPDAAQTYPLFIIVVLLVLTTMYVIKMIIDAKRKGILSGLEDFKDFLPGQFFPVLVMVILYLIAMYFLGFYISTVVFMIAALLFLRVPKWQIILSCAVVLLIVYGAFTMFLGVKLPLGLLFG